MDQIEFILAQLQKSKFRSAFILKQKEKLYRNSYETTNYKQRLYTELFSNITTKYAYRYTSPRYRQKLGRLHWRGFGNRSCVQKYI